jgi:ectoine hydroxylase-related dioxygenase (phytanoyl-CoA dioxygenase family)
VNHHDDWNKLSRSYIRRLVSVALQKPHVLLKEKLNLKPPGGSGFAPHLDGPSLRVALGAGGPRTFLTVMVAIDDMTIANGCLKIVKGNWNELNACQTVQPDVNGSPDAGGRAGAIPTAVADDMSFEDLVIDAGTIVVFNAWMPHRSSANKSPFPRRAVFLTYNLAEEGDFHDEYYTKMTRLRNEWRISAGMGPVVATDDDDELKALVTIPNI